MTAKEYLMQVADADRRIEVLSAQIARMEMLEKRSGRAMEGDEAVERIARLKEELRGEIGRWEELRREVADAIAAVPKESHRLLLEYRYLCGWELRRTAIRMHYSVDRIWHLHSDALREFRVPEKGQQAATGMRN